MPASDFDKLPPPLPGRRGWPWEIDRSLSSSAADLSGRSRPTVSIVTPSFNQGAFIEESIRSVLLQSHPAIEYIIIDGGSTDESVDIIHKYEHLLAHWISEPDKGQADALQRGFSLAQGEIVAYLNADDVYTPGAIAAAAATLRSNPGLALVHGDSVIINAAGDPIGHKRGEEGPYLPYFLRMANPISQPSAFWRRRDYEAIGGIDSRLHYIMDYDLWSRMGLLGREFKHITADLSQFRIHASSKTKQSMVPFEQERLMLVQEYLQNDAFSYILMPHAQRLLGTAHLRLANAYCVDGSRPEAWSHYQTAVRCEPQLAYSWPSINLLLRLLLGKRSFRKQYVDHA